MNQEAVFALRFVTKDLAKMQKGIDAINKNLEKLNKTAGKGNKTFNNQTKEVNKLNQSFTKAAKGAIKFALAYVTVQKIFNTAMKNANESLQLHLMADMAGVAAEKVNKLGRALLRYSGDAKSAGSAYRSLSDIIGGATHGMGISEDVSRVNAMYGIGINYGNISEDELMTNIAIAMNRLKNNGDTWGIRQIASAYGLDESMADFLATEGANWAAKRDTYEAPLTEREAAIQQVEEVKKIETQFDVLVNTIMPAVKTTLEYISDAIEVIANFFGYDKTSKRIQRQNEEDKKQLEESRKKLQKSGYEVWESPNKKEQVWKTFAAEKGTNDYEELSDFWAAKKFLRLKNNEYFLNRDMGQAQIILKRFKELKTADELDSLLNIMNEQNQNINKGYHHEVAMNSTRSMGINPEGNFYIDVGGIRIEDTSGTLKGKYNALTKEIQDRVFQNAYENAMSSPALKRALNPSLVK